MFLLLEMDEINILKFWKWFSYNGIRMICDYKIHIWEELLGRLSERVSVEGSRFIIYGHFL